LYYRNWYFSYIICINALEVEIMKRLLKKTAWGVVLMPVAGLALAHSVSGSLGKTTTGAAATDVYLINCYNDDEGAGNPNKIFMRVKDNAPKLASTVSVQVIKGGLATVPSIDPVDGDAGYSPAISLTRGAGEYTVIVNKSALAVKGLENYTLEFHCQSASGGHAGTDWITSQNQ
jgi:hypothetical protein